MRIRIEYKYTIKPALPYNRQSPRLRPPIGLAASKQEHCGHQLQVHTDSLWFLFEAMYPVLNRSGS